MISNFEMIVTRDSNYMFIFNKLIILNAAKFTILLEQNKSIS